MYHGFSLHGMFKDCNPDGWQTFAIHLCWYLKSKYDRIRNLPKWQPRIGYYIYIVNFISQVKEALLPQLSFHFLLGAQNILVPWWQFCVVALSFEVASRVFEYLCTPDVHWIYMWWESMMLLVAIWGATCVLGLHYSHGWKLCRTHFTHRSCFSM